MILPALAASLVNPLITSFKYPTSWDRYGALNSTVSWQDCTGLGDVKYFCGTFDVPLDYSDPSQGKAVLALAKFSAVKKPRLGTLFLNPGGPGASGTLYLNYVGPSLLNITGGQYDIVSFDPRGVGNTLPGVKCFDSVEDHRAFWRDTVPWTGIEAFGKFTDPEETDPDVREFRAQEPLVDTLLGVVGEICSMKNGDVLRYVGTAAVTRDMVALADVLEGGSSLINYWGLSYGTIIGSYLVNMFPERVGRVLLDGVVNPVEWAAGPAYILTGSSFEDTDTVFTGFVSACADAGPSRCPMTWRGASAEDIKSWIEVVIGLADELHAQGKTEYGSAYIRQSLFSAMYDPEFWPGAAEDLSRLASLYDAIIRNASTDGLYEDHDQTFTGGGLLAPFPVRSSPGVIAQRRVLKEPMGEVLPYSLYAIACGDAQDAGNTTTTDVFEAVVSTALNISMLFGPILWDSGQWCHKWPVRAVERYSGPWNRTLRHPILVTGNVADPITPFSGARLVADMLGDRAVLFQREGFGHVSNSQPSRCVDRIIGDFFSKGLYPPNGTLCATEQTLFPPSERRRSQDLHLRR